MIGAIALDGFRGMMTINSGTSNDVFIVYVEQVLCPKLRSGDIVVMDNLSAHKSKRVEDLIQSRGATVMFTPPYSPEFNPIEEAWAKIKDVIRRTANNTRDEFDAALKLAMDAVSLTDIENWVTYAGYT